MIFETHAHYDDEAFQEDRKELLARMKASGIGRIVNIGASIETTKAALELAKQYDFIYAAAGVHPSDIDGLNEDTFAWLKEQMVWEETVAVGEIGLDYYWEKDPAQQEKQKYWFRRQMELAEEVSLPVVIHSREAAKDTMDILRAFDLGERRGVIHCYSYSKEMALAYVEMGYYIGVGGVITFKNAKKLVETVEEVPLERIVLETDSPYLAPEPYRGKRNTSLNLPYVVDKIAEIKGVSAEEVEAATWENAFRLYPKVQNCKAN